MGVAQRQSWQWGGSWLLLTESLTLGQKVGRIVIDVLDGDGEAS